MRWWCVGQTAAWRACGARSAMTCVEAPRSERTSPDLGCGHVPRHCPARRVDPSHCQTRIVTRRLPYSNAFSPHGRSPYRGTSV